MENLRQILIMALIIMTISTTFISCKKDTPDEFVGTIEISKTETNVFARFVIPEGTKVDKIVIKGTLYEYEETEQEKVSIMPFTITGTEIHGNFRNIVINKSTMGQPVPGAEIIIEQEPNDDPVAMGTTDIDNGSFIIEIKNPSTGFYTMMCTGFNTKGGFAVGGFNAT